MQKNTLNKLTLISLLASATATSTWACNGSHVIGIGAGHTATAYTISANTMKKGSLYLGVNAETVRNKNLSDSAMEADGGDHLHAIDSVNAYSLSASYGITDDLTLNVQLPYVTRKGIRAGEDHGGSFEVHPHDDIKELGDASALLQYKVYDDKFKVALLAGLKAPTGKDDVTFEGEVLEADLQSGSGSWDLFAGVAFTKDFEDFSLHSDILYKHNNKGVGNSELGDILTYNVALSYTLLDHKPHTALTGLEKENHRGYSVDTFIELNGERAGEDRFNGSIAGNTGHNIIFASTGLQVSTENNYSFFVSVSVPVYQDMKGVQNDVSFKSTIGIGKSF
ncbi:MAG: transporter [Sulfuricurvum sp.]|nr:transporter [Sulfuricurvum sp.]MDP3021773.1 transporter [Sulfuricurvum sp.]